MRFLTKAAYAAPSVGFAGISLPLLIFLPTYYATQRDVPIAAVGAAFAIIRLLDIGFDPLIGAAMDRTRTRFGRFKPWMAIGAPLFMLAVYALFMPPAGAGLAYLIACLLGAYTAWSICFVAQLGWGVALSGDYAERNSIFGWWQAAYLLGSLVITTLPLTPALRANPAIAVPTMGAFILVATPLAVILALLVVPEPMSGPRPKVALADYLKLMVRPNIARLLAIDLLVGVAVNTNAALFFFYFGFARGVPFTQAAILLFATNLGSLAGALLWGRLGSALGKHRAAMAGLVAYAVLLVAVQVAPVSSLPVGAAVMLLFGATLSAGPVLVRSMLADVGDEERLLRGVDHTGLISALFSNSSKLGAVIGPAIAFAVLGATGFQAKASAQAPAALNALIGLAIWAPAVVGLLAALLARGHTLTAQAHAAVRARLDQKASAAEIAV
jgi:Na+/melibiose symporter-like transporter